MTFLSTICDTTNLLKRTTDLVYASHTYKKNECYNMNI